MVLSMVLDDEKLLFGFCVVPMASILVWSKYTFEEIVLYSLPRKSYATCSIIVDLDHHHNPSQP
ncbi:hypothetical protein BO94DRAFT_517446 [Aspergillus sclerotioniger CBS 115572]|uniref:Uncharacterized protein n=1 Tax=Aspergillus sclerotioniger CBS 115572 TaxID=1450535 RepID=A0A317WM38_9EURO|nr:hypothetical protein BO94DRAFT_517446 [Aspergillus sclerotioniger CBS 115572]PWY86392.1 hypothetical protein BO94DRAFT_517446 [Aspergillus sclerotioniger CBS 115572]